MGSARARIAANQLILLKLPSFKRIFTDDFPKDIQSTIEKLCNYINPNTEYVYTALNNQLTFADNFYATTKTITVSVDSTGKPTATAVIQLTVVNNTIPKASGTLVILAQNQTNSTTYPTGGIFISFTQSGSTITINNITGLPANNSFLLNVIVFH